MFSFIKFLLSSFFSKKNDTEENKYPMFIKCPRMNEEVLIDAQYHQDGHLTVNFSYVQQDMLWRVKYTLSEKEMKIAEDLVRVAEGCLLTIGPQSPAKDDNYAMFVFKDHLRLEFFSITPLEAGSIETQPIEVDFSLYPAVWIGFFDMFAIGELVTKYHGEYCIIMNENKTIARVIFQDECSDTIKTWAIADKMLISLDKKNNLVEIIIGGLTQHTDLD